MSDRLEGQNRSDSERQAFSDVPEGRRSHKIEWDRLEEIGDLHFEGSAYSSAIDYYLRLLNDGHGYGVSSKQCLIILRKCVSAALRIGNLNLAESLLARSSEFLNAIPDISGTERNRLMAPLLGSRAGLLFQRGSYRDALQSAKHAFTVLAITDEHKEVAYLQLVMGICHYRLGRLAKAEEFYSDALSTFRRIGDELGTATIFNNLALCHLNACRWDRSLGFIDKALDIANKQGATILLSGLHLNRGIILIKMNRLGEARTSLVKCLRLSNSLGDISRRSKVCLALGKLEMKAGRLARAEELILEGKTLTEQEHFLRERTIADEYLGDILLAHGEVSKALYNYQLGLESCKKLGKTNDIEGELQRRIGEAQRRLGNLDEAIEACESAIETCKSCGEVYELGFCYQTLGKVFAERLEWEQVDTYFRKSISTFKKQNLTLEWCHAILEFFETRSASAGQREFLLLRRDLLQAQEEAASTVSDHVLCLVLRALAEVQLRLGQFDDSMLTVCELERNVSGTNDSDLLESVSTLRNRIESGILGEIEGTGSHVQAISGIPGIFNRNDPSIPRNLSSVLQAGMEKVTANCGFIAMETESDGDSPLRIVAREGVTDNLAGQLARWFSLHEQFDSTGSVLFSRLSTQDPLLKAVPALQGLARSCVFMPIAMDGSRFGLLFLGKTQGHSTQEGFGRPELDFLATYMGFLALFLLEKSRGGGMGQDHHIPSPIEGVASFENIITQNEAMLEVLSLIRKVAPSELTTLLNGETGTGKGLLAYAIHALSRRHRNKYLAINCAAIPESLLESELFGHKKGSFTGAYDDKPGLLVEAEGGSVFLDEIGKMPVSMQGKLLHFLDTKVVRPVGSVHEQRVDVRIICASKTDLQKLASQGLFLEDLYYRLLDFPLFIPPLRERRDDIQLLMQHFIDRFSQELGVEALGYGTPFMDALNHHDWPGNVRELEKCLKRALVLPQGEQVLRPEHLPTAIAGYSVSIGTESTIPPLRETIGSVECREITQALKMTRGNKSKAARILQIRYPSLLKKIRFYGIHMN